MSKIPPAPFSRGSSGLRPQKDSQVFSEVLYSPLKMGLGGFSELLFKVGKLFNHESQIRK